MRLCATLLLRDRSSKSAASQLLDEIKFLVCRPPVHTLACGQPMKPMKRLKLRLACRLTDEAADSTCLAQGFGLAHDFGSEHEKKQDRIYENTIGTTMVS